MGSGAAGEVGEETPRGASRKGEETRIMERKHAAEQWEEREQKLERVRRAKAALEENPDALRKGRWPRCT